MTKVLGVDVGAKFVVAFCLESLPTGISYPKYYYQNAKSCLHKIRIDNKKEESTINIQDAIALLRELKPDCIVMEPTGVWYSKLWYRLALHLGIEVKWMGHGDLAFRRGAYGFKDKDDRTDAYCLALSYFDPVFNANNKWLLWKTGAIADVNDRMLELESLNVTTKILIQQLRQRLTFEFPECAKRSISSGCTHNGFTAWIGWLGGIHTSTRIQNGYNRSIVRELGIEISTYTREHAQAIAGNQIRETRILDELSESLLDPAFDRYRPILEKFGFGTKMQAVILSQAYPFEKFLVEGKQYRERYEDDRGEKRKNVSLAGFQISLGMGKRLVESGNTTVLLYSGSSFARKKLYTWIVTNVLPEKMADSWLVQEIDKRALSNPKPAMTVAQLRTRWKTTNGSPRDKHMAGVRSAMTLGYRITRLLYDEFLKEVTP